MRVAWVQMCNTEDVFGNPEKAEAGLYFDTAMHITASGEIFFKYRKVHPAGVLSLERPCFRYGTRFGAHAINDWKVGISRCLDMGSPETARCLSPTAAQRLIAPYATPHANLFQESLRTRPHRVALTTRLAD